MFGSKILEVVIGIIFIFLLYSLLVTAIQEIISSFFFLRARMLRQSIRRMLLDSKSLKCKDLNHGFWKGLWIKTINAFTFFFPGVVRFWKAEENIATWFYEQPGIKYIGQSNWYKRPAFIKPESFAKTIADILIANAKDELDDNQKIYKALESNSIKTKTTVIAFDPETLSYIRSLWRDAKQDVAQFRLLLGNWFQETMDRLSAVPQTTGKTSFFRSSTLIFGISQPAIELTGL